MIDKLPTFQALNQFNLSLAFVAIGTIFDVGVWYYVKNLQIFDDEKASTETKVDDRGTGTSREANTILVDLPLQRPWNLYLFYGV